MPVHDQRAIAPGWHQLWPFHVLGVVENPPWARGGLTLANYDYYDQDAALGQAGHVGQLTILLKDPDRAAAFTDQIDRTFASSPNPTFAVTDKSDAAEWRDNPIQHSPGDQGRVRRRAFHDSVS